MRFNQTFIVSCILIELILNLNVGSHHLKYKLRFRNSIIIIFVICFMNLHVYDAMTQVNQTLIVSYIVTELVLNLHVCSQHLNYKLRFRNSVIISFCDMLYVSTFIDCDVAIRSTSVGKGACNKTGTALLKGACG